MYKEFSVISIEPLMAKKQIVITTNKELNILYFDNKTIIVLNKIDLLHNNENYKKIKFTLAFFSK